MAVTVLRHLKESKKGNPAAHLSNSIRYICNPEKTEQGTLIFSNCGTNPQEIYDSMIATKERYQKRWGRQGYHYVISLPPGEGSPDIMYRIAKEFCQELLSDFDYVFAVHTDQNHCHAHIVFNSVNAVDGYKYRYNNGDWARLIQPVTDKLCEKYGLSTLSYDPDEPRAGKTYVEHMAIKNDRLTLRDLVRMDIDAAVQEAVSEEDYFDFLKSRGYTWRAGNSKTHGEYVAYRLSDTEKAIRDYTLGEGYAISEIRQRLSVDPYETNDIDPYQILQEKVDIWFPGDKLKIYRMSEQRKSRYQVVMIRRIDQAIRHYDYDLTLSEHIRVRHVLLQIDRLRQECEYLMDTGYESMEQLQNRLSEVRYELKNYRDKPKDDNRNRLYSERRILRQLIKDYRDTMEIRDASEVHGKEMRYGREEKAIEGRDTKLHEADIPAPSHIR